VAIGLVPVTALPAAAAFAFIGLTLFVLAWQDAEWGPVGSLLPLPAPSRPAAVERHRRAIPVPFATAAAAPMARARPGVAARASPPVAPRPSLTVGDALWTRLTPDASGVLPVELVGPIAQSTLETLPGESYDAPPIETVVWEDTAMGSGPVATWAGFPAGPDPGWSPIESEAFNHLPPHLRADPSSWKEIRGPHPPTAPARPPGAAECASCHRGLTNPPAWRSCTSCHRPFCGECAFRAKRNLGAGRCVECRRHLEIEEPRFIA